jgi:hypothetical protein
LLVLTALPRREVRPGELVGAVPLSMIGERRTIGAVGDGCDAAGRAPAGRGCGAGEREAVGGARAVGARAGGADVGALSPGKRPRNGESRSAVLDRGAGGRSAVRSADVPSADVRWVGRRSPGEPVTGGIPPTGVGARSTAGVLTGASS